MTTTSPMSTSSKDTILALAVAEIDKGGEAALRVKRIADDAGTAVTSIYHFYGSREGLVEAAQIARFEAGYGQARDQFVNAARTIESRDEFARSLEIILRDLFSPRHRKNRLRRMSVVGSAIARPELLAAINEVQRQWLAELLDGLTIAQERGLIDPQVDVNTAATWHLVTVNGFASIEGDSTGADVAKWVDFYIDTMFRAIGLR